MRIQLGTRLDGPPGPKYRSTLRFGEFDLRGGLPKPSKLRDWCKQDADGGFDSSLVAPSELVFDERGRPFPKGERAVFDRLGSAAEALGARFLVIETGPKLSPSLRDRERFFAYCDSLAATPTCPQIVWRAGGLWESEEVVELCEKHNLGVALDPFSDELPTLANIYLQLRAEGGTRRFGEDHFVRLIRKLEANAALEDVVIAIDSDQSFREAGRLQKLLVEFDMLTPNVSTDVGA